MTKMIVLLVLSISSLAFAGPQDPCFDVLDKKFAADSEKSDWRYERIQRLSLKDAQVMIKEALAEDEEKDRPVMMKLSKDPQVIFYMMGWSAMSNSGTTIIAADKNTCNVIEDLLYWSEE